MATDRPVSPPASTERVELIGALELRPDTLAWVFSRPLSERERDHLTELMTFHARNLPITMPAPTSSIA